MKIISTLFVFLTLSSQSFAQQIAFPGAEGAGRFTSGGRGTASVPTTVFEVTRIDDPSPTVAGTLRYAVTNNSPAAAHRTVIFRVSGTIRLTSPLSLNRSNTTIAGQTAPGDGICIADYPVSISADNLIVRFIRFRLGDRHQEARSGNDDAFSGTGRKNIIIDHCSMSWSNDETFTVYNGDSTTLQWNLMSEPLDSSYHVEGGPVQRHGYGGIWGGRRTSAHHNLVAHVRGRAPRFNGSRSLPNETSPVVGSENVDFRNNVIYNWADYNVNGGEGGNYNVVNNYYKYGSNTPSTNTSGVNRRNMVINPSQQASPYLPYGKFFLEGNFVENSDAVTARNWLGAAMSGGSLSDTNQSKVNEPFDIAPLATHTALEAYELVLQNAGAILPRRDTLDQRIANDVRNRTGRIINRQGNYPRDVPFEQTLDAWPTLNSAPAPTDTDRDGMPDDWETANGSNPNNAADRSVIESNGYTRLENYLNSIVHNAVMPLKLVSFGGSLQQKQVRLVWSTTNEVNTEKFIIERSADGISFYPVSNVAASNSRNTTNNYSFSDIKPLEGKSYYRLKMIDKEGAYSFSAILSFNAITKAGLSINPNPVIKNIVATHPKALQNSQLQAYSLDGKLQFSYKLNAGTEQSSFDVSGLSSGVYTLMFINNNERISQRFVKQ